MKSRKNGGQAKPRERKKVHIFPLDAYLRGNQDDISFRSVMLTENHTEERILDQLRMEELQNSLVDWKPWGTYLLELYLAGERKVAFQRL